ncbi:SAM-dependent methyltransferase [Herbiconiux sp. CPCC 205716]|uniref:SAM-dependent methyltransferase n=1 Tax=Herbiconiux gentiana TaxID=2970912 RepID=A0ABT2G9V9_9MICO|nr:SAM-dependent methyltransferase [Herbiconiux gentiana]MCS5712987.1 SAM-dependent methyltransferase [Herbiconiux gentiana]
MPPSLPFLLDRTDLHLAELHAARLDGDLVGVGDRFSPADIAGTVDLRGARELRALSLLPRLPVGLVVERRTAAWLHGAWAAPPGPLELCVRSDHRVRVVPDVAWSVRQAVLRPDELILVRGVLSTTPLRTALDLLRLPPDDRYDGRHRSAVITLLLMQTSGRERAAAALHRSPHLPHKQRALDRLAALSLR